MRPTVLPVLAFLVLAGQPLEGQSVSASPAYGTVTLEAGFLPDPHTTNLTAGGSIDINMGECTYGQVADAPDVDLYFTAGNASSLYIYAEAKNDITLLINLPDGSWLCNDDGYTGTNPMIIVPKAAGGLYDIWVGTYGTELTSATLSISEIDPR